MGWMLGCLPQPRPTPSSGSETAGADESSNSDAAPPRIEWLDGGRGLVLDNRWWYRPDEQTFRAIPRPDEAPRYWWRSSIAAASESVLWFDGAQALEIRSLSDSSALRTTIPLWITPDEMDPDDPSAQERAPRNIPFWGPDGNVFVQQYFLFASDRVACGSFETAAQRWTLVAEKPCIEASFSALTAVEEIAAGLFEVTSSAEGGGALDLVSLKSDDDLADTTRTLFSVNGVEPAPLQLALRADEPRIVVWCPLAEETFDSLRCLEDSDARRDEWAVYTVSESGDMLVPVARGLPRELRLDPSGTRLAWKRDGQVCIRELAAGDPECATIPKSAPPLP